MRKIASKESSDSLRILNYMFLSSILLTRATSFRWIKSKPINLSKQWRNAGAYRNEPYN